MATVVRKRVKKIKAPVILEVGEVTTEPTPRQEPDWKESITDSSRVLPKNKHCKPCIKRDSCVITKLACVMYCDKIEIKKKRIRK